MLLRKRNEILGEVPSTEKNNINKVEKNINEADSTSVFTPTCLESILNEKSAKKKNKSENFMKKGRKLPRNRKKYWRKIKVDDVEQRNWKEGILEEQILGLDTSISRKPDNELFFTDTTGVGSDETTFINDIEIKVEEDGVDDDKEEEMKKPEILQRSKRRINYRDKLIQGDTPLINQSAVPAFQSKRPSSRKTRKHVQNLKMKNLIRHHCSQSESKIKRNHCGDEKIVSKFPRMNKRLERVANDNTSGMYDLWADDSIKPNKKPQDPNEAYYEDCVRHRIFTRKNLKEKPSQLLAIEYPHPGTSYNPTYQHHEELLQLAHAKEAAIERGQQKLHRQLDEKFPSSKDAPTFQTWIDEMSEGIFDDRGHAVDEKGVDKSEKESTVFSEQSKKDGDIGETLKSIAAETTDRSTIIMDQMRKERELSAAKKEIISEEKDECAITTNPPVRREDKKSRQQRRRQLEQKRAKRQKILLKKANILKNDLYRIKSLHKEIDIDEKLTSEKIAERLKREHEREKFATKRLGSRKFEGASMEVKLPTDMEKEKTGDGLISLRRMKPEGHLLKDRFVSLQKRNIIEPRERAKVIRKYKKKKFKQRSYDNK